MQYHPDIDFDECARPSNNPEILDLRRCDVGHGVAPDGKEGV
jgi:hypothetical protein